MEPIFVGEIIRIKVFPPDGIIAFAFILDVVANFFDKGRVFALARVAVNSALVEIVPARGLLIFFFPIYIGGRQVDLIVEDPREQHIHTNGDSKLSKLFVNVFPIFEELKVLVV